MTINFHWILAIVALAGILHGTWAAAPAAEPDKAGVRPERLWVYVGTYTRRASKGIYLGHLDLATGRLESVELAGELTNPSFLAIHPSRPLLYAVGELGDFAGKKTGAVSALAIDPQSGKLRLLNQQSSGGPGPCHLTVDRTGRCVLVANYSGGSVACLPIEDDGRLGKATFFDQHQGSGPSSKRQDGPHAHSIQLDAANRFVFSPDLGLDKVFIYRFDADGRKMTPNDPAFAAVAPGSGPRHFDFHPGGRYAYVINELGSTITAFRYDAQRGALEPLQTVSTLPEGFQGDNTTADVHVHPSGKFLYGSNRGHDSIAIFAIEAESGKLRPVGHEPTQGKTPRNFGIDPTGTHLLAANQDTGNVVVFRIDATTGKLQPTGSSANVAYPVCVKIIRPLAP